MKRTNLLLFVTTVLLLLSLAACELPAPGSQPPPATDTPVSPLLGAPTLPPFLPSPTPSVVPAVSPTPTPDPALQAASATPPPAPEATAAPVQETSPTGEIIHTVQAGENLFRIGLRYGISYQELAAYNGISNPNVLSVGQQIKIPARP